MLEIPSLKCWRSAAALAVTSLALGACAGPVTGADGGPGLGDAGSAPTLPGCARVIQVPTRVHLLASSSPSLNATWTADEARARLRAAADFWASHCLLLVEERIVTTRAEAAGEGAFASATASAPVDRMRLRKALSDSVPRGELLTPGWNVFVIRDFNAPSVGVYVPDLGVQSIFIAQQRVDGVPLPPLVLAHEFGHSFALEHYVGPDREQNLMRDDPDALTGPATLTPAQVDAAKAQADSGGPRG